MTQLHQICVRAKIARRYGGKFGSRLTAIADKRTSVVPDLSAPIYDGVDVPDGIDAPKRRC
jgi:hypothetical protein